MSDVFCKIIKKELPADIVDESGDWLAIKDIHPQAPVHILIMPKKHFDFPDIGEQDSEIIGKMIVGAGSVAKKLNLEKGFRLIINSGEHGGQLVPHFHIHLIGGGKLGPKIVRDNIMK
ncbi:MAG: HIT domain-containing protein [Candidatus Yanofskybacteria bacterium]|nr:HIT domain-containing protein [Candidatus Yanofskybacteria bacterium]